ncbi:apolipoprotein D-like [Cotesia glomerata]|uniref:Lipocalin/cytosolic fatty-acid binding domain-containing protein n=1 Tax=Cotesia glomerata TaxID=32391 RepID=A0AAV7J3F6_COTGL|nr:apolipoprotein D-like [Cotesia glomerata]KAH0567325.1 hypothetical protein KQX54_008422 [Cotesia glomerata]
MLSLILFSLVTNSFAQSSDLINCSSVTPMAGFQVQNYTGRWYEIEYTLNPWQTHESCTAFLYQYDANNNTLEIRGRTLNINTRLRHQCDGITKINNDNPASMLIYLPPFALPVPINFIIVDTDYENYGAAIQCSATEPSLPNAWLIGRKRTLERKYILRGERALRANGIPTNRLVYNRHPNCPEDW